MKIHQRAFSVSTKSRCRLFFLFMLAFCTLILCFSVSSLRQKREYPWGETFSLHDSQFPKLKPLNPVFTEFKLYDPSENYVPLNTMDEVQRDMKANNITMEMVQQEADDLRAFASSVHDAKPPRNLQYEPGTFGLVINCYKKGLLLTVTNLMYLMHAFSVAPPIEVWVDLDADVGWAESFIRKTCPAGIVTVRSLESVRDSIEQVVGELQSLENARIYYTKLHAVMGSKFQRVLFIDSDAYLLQNPFTLLQTFMERNVSAATWLDCYGPDRNNPFFEAIGIPKKPGTGFESGIMYFDKENVWDALLVSCRVNHRHIFYYSLFHGDKDLYYFAFSLTGKTLHYPLFLPGRLGLSVEGNVILGGIFLQPDFDGRGGYVHFTSQKMKVFPLLDEDMNVMKKLLIYNGNKAHMRAMKGNHYQVFCDNEDNDNCIKTMDAEMAIGNFYEAIRYSYLMATYHLTENAGLLL